jgi:hypothetical protein
MEVMKNVYCYCKLLSKKPERNAPLRRTEHRRKGNITMDKEKRCEVVDLIHLAQDGDQWQAIMNPVMSHWVL